MGASVVTVSRTMAAPAFEIFEILADPARHPDIDGSGSVRSVRTGTPARLSLGARFAMDMRIGARYRITNQVVEFEEGRRIAWRHFNGHVWRYVLTPEAANSAGVGENGRTLVTEQWDPTTAKHRRLLSLLGFPGRNRRGMQATLLRLAELVERSGDPAD
jgi:uncharacterized protein YndB with AHSA1/START domain